MSLRASLAAWIFGASASVCPAPRQRVTSTITDGLIARSHEARLVESGRQAVDDLLARTRVERAGHFDVPRVGA